MHKKVIVNSTPILTLAEIGQLDILKLVYGEIIIPVAVFNEVTVKDKQPTLSHHMKILCDSGLVKGRKEGKWIYYSLNDSVIKNIKEFLDNVTKLKDDCICNIETKVILYG